MFQFLVQRKKQEAEERRMKQKKAREEFKKMLEVSYILLERFFFLWIEISLFPFLIYVMKSLQECSELTSSTRWGFVFPCVNIWYSVYNICNGWLMRMVKLSYRKVESIFEHDERFKAVERDRDRRDMFENYVEELQKKVSFWYLDCSPLFVTFPCMLQMFTPLSYKNVHCIEQL